MFGGREIKAKAKPERKGILANTFKPKVHAATDAPKFESKRKMSTMGKYRWRLFFVVSGGIDN
jgi:hypothetical protein